jgi:tetratricopeptide (TPR) repeat protein
MCDAVPVFQNARIYRHLARGELGSLNRRLGRYDTAIEILETTLREMAASERSLELSGELGVIYRHMARLEDAKRVLEIQYATAKELGSERVRCRVIGNLAMVNYQLYLKSNKQELLEEAFWQLLERIQDARRLGIPMWESIGLARISLCHAARGDTELAVEASLASLDLSRRLEDPTVIAMSHFFYGHALRLDGQQDEAFNHLNNYEGCTPAIAFCKEPSEEHLGYLQELVEAGVDLNLSDEHGYNALDYAVFSGHAETEECVIRGLRQTLTGDIERQLLERLDESRLRKCYRELFQETLRPILLSRDTIAGLNNLRLAYASALATDPQKGKMFDTLRYVKYCDFQRLGRLPRLTDNITCEFNPEADVDTSLSLIFYSYRWLKTSTESNPDDENGTQFKRMLNATEAFLECHPKVDRDSLCVWLVSLLLSRAWY